MLFHNKNHLVTNFQYNMRQLKYYIIKKMSKFEFHHKHNIMNPLECILFLIDHTENKINAVESSAV